MTNYQTEIQNIGDIRWGSAKIEIYDDSTTAWKNLGAVKNVVATTTTSGEQKFEPDNAPSIKIDPVPESWDWSFDLQEAWNADTLKLLRGNIDTWSTTTTKTVVGVYAGTGARPYRKFRITNTTAGLQPAVIVLNKCKLTSELDWNFPTDKDGTTALALSVKISAEIDGVNGFGTLDIPKAAGTVTISPESVSITVGATQTMTVSGATNVTFGTTDVSIATVSSAGVVTGVAEGITQLIITTDGVTHIIPVMVTDE